MPQQHGDRGQLVPLGGEKGGFGDTLANAINQVSMTQDRSSELTAAFLRGENVEVHQVMAASEEGAAPPTGADKLESLPVSAEPTVASETADVVEEKHCYDKKKSFFDSISCEAVERSKG